MLTSGAFGYLGDYVLWWLLYVSLLVHTWCFFRFFPREKLRKMGLVIGNGFVLTCLTGMAALAGESYYRFSAVETDTFGWSVAAKRWFALYTRLNSLGCRDSEWAVDKPPGVRRIAFVGDSFTYGWGIERVEDRFSDRLQAMFDQRSPGTVEVMNVAKPGWSTGAELQPIRDMIDLFGVDEVVLCYVPNDIEDLLPRSDDFDPIHPPQPRFFNPDLSCLADHLYRRVWLPRAPTVRGYHDWLADGFADAGIWKEHRETLSLIVKQCRDRNVSLRVVLLPFVRTGGERYQARMVHGQLGRFFEASGLPVADLLDVIVGEDPADLIVNEHDTHPNRRAHERYARAIWQSFYADSSP